MKFKKFVFISLSSILSCSLSLSTQAAEKVQSIDAIWNSVGVSATSRSSLKKQINTNNVVPAKLVVKKLTTTNNNLKYTRAQYQARYKNEQDLKLARQRAAWKAKWNAQQHANAKQQITNKRSAVTKKPVGQPIWKNPRNNQIARKNVNQAPKKLTRAQYQERWKRQQAQLKKQQPRKIVQQVQQQLPPVVLSHNTFRPSNQAATYQRLPVDIVKKLRAGGIREHGVSAYVQDVNSPKPLLAVNDKTSRVPASVMKLITSYAALGTLGPNYRWPLDVLTTGSIRNGTLTGDLIIKGYGSPEFNTAELRKVLQGIRQKGIRNVNGRVLFDNTYFRPLSAHAGAFDGKAMAAYNARPDALLFNERINTFNLRASGKGVRVTSLTPTHGLKIVNRMSRFKRSCRARMGVSKRGHQTVVTFTGGLARRCGTRTFARVFSEPSNMIYGSMRSMWKRDVGGTLNTRFAMGKAPSNAKHLLRTYSRTLAQILPMIAKDSNNVMARQLLLTIGAKKTGRTGTEKNGAQAVSRWLASRGLNFPELRIENGSGLSRHARISARHLGNLMVDAYRSPYRNVLMQSLAIAGVDGTMKRRLRGTHVRGRGYFKTGTLRDVRSIAGYVKAANGKTYVMAILHNDPKARRRALPAHDKLIEWVFAGGRSGRQVAMR